MKTSSIKWMLVIILISAFAVAAVAVRESSGVEERHFKEAQVLIDKMVAKYPALVRLTIHAVPTGEKGSRIIACNIEEKIGKASDLEDLEAMKTGKTVTLKEGNNLDVTAPIIDKTGKPIAATGITLRFRKGETEEQVIERAKSIARELNAAIQDSDKPFW